MTNGFAGAAFQVALIGLGAAALAGCSSSGDSDSGGKGGQTPSGYSTFTPDNSTLGNNFDLPWANNVGDNLNNLRDGDEFPLVQTAVSISSTEFGPDEAVNNGGATLEIIALAGDRPDQVQLSIPGLSIENMPMGYDAVDEEFVGSNGAQEFRMTLYRETDFGELNYTTVGLWETGDIGALAATGSYFYTGFQSPELPLTGEAIYDGNTTGLFVSGDAQRIATVNGDAQLVVDFFDYDVEGTLYNMTATAEGGGEYAFNDVEFRRGAIIHGNEFNGQSIVTSTPDGALNSDAQGSFNGTFFGPLAEEAAWTWTLRDGDGNTAVGVAAGAY